MPFDPGGGNIAGEPQWRPPKPPKPDPDWMPAQPPGPGGVASTGGWEPYERDNGGGGAVVGYMGGGTYRPAVLVPPSLPFGLGQAENVVQVVRRRPLEPGGQPGVRLRVPGESHYRQLAAPRVPEARTPFGPGWAADYGTWATDTERRQAESTKPEWAHQVAPGVQWPYDPDYELMHSGPGWAADYGTPGTDTERLEDSYNAGLGLGVAPNSRSAQDDSWTAQVYGVPEDYARWFRENFGRLPDFYRRNGGDISVVTNDYRTLGSIWQYSTGRAMTPQDRREVLPQVTQYLSRIRGTGRTPELWDAWDFVKSYGLHGRPSDAAHPAAWSGADFETPYHRPLESYVQQANAWLYNNLPWWLFGPYGLGRPGGVRVQTP